MQIASIGRRFGAHLIDLFILVCIGFAIGVMAAIPMFIFAIVDDGGGFISAILNYILNVVLVVIVVLYYSITESSKMRGTVGKRIMGIAVIDEYGEQLTFKKALLRGLVKCLLSGILTIGYIMAFFTKDRQSLHDTVAKTYVVNR